MFEELKTYMTKRFEQEFKLQGHSLTGAAERSIEYKEVIQGANIKISMLANDYVVYVDKGVKPEEIIHPYAPPRIEGLTKFWEKKGLEDDDAVSAAYATATMHAKEGLSTTYSRRFSKSMGNKRQDFTSEMTTPQDIDKMAEIIGQTIFTEIDAKITNLVQETNKKLK